MLGFANPKTEIGGEDPTAANWSRVDLALVLGGQYDLCECFRIHGDFQWRDSGDFGAGYPSRP